MSITTQSIPNIGSPADDPTLQLPGTLFIPDSIKTPSPWRCVVGTVAGHFRESNDLVPITSLMKDLAQNGFLCLAHYVRLTNPIPGQTTTGRWHQQTDDLKIGIRAMRNNPFGLGFNVTGSVSTLGGSGSGHHALYCAIDGTVSDDRANAAIALSPVTDFSDRDPDVNHPDFIQGVTTYGNSTDLGILLAESPISLNLSQASPIRHYNGDNESMPLSQWTRFKTAMETAGVQTYVPIENIGDLGKKHAFSMWAAIKLETIKWLMSVA